MNNTMSAGICAYCEEYSDRLFEPPLLVPDNWREEVQYDGGLGVWWHPPGQAYPGKNLYDVIDVEGDEYLRPYETPDEPICWECFDGNVCPAERKYCVNLPKQIKFNGWKKPEWLGETAVSQEVSA